MTLANRRLSGLAALLVLAACEDAPTRVTLPSVPADEPVLQGQSPLVELTISGIGSDNLTTSARMLPGWTPARPVRPRSPLAAAAAQGSRVQREINRTPDGRVLDFSRDGVWKVRARQVSATRRTLLARGDFAALNAPMAAPSATASAAAVTGTVRVPAILFRFNDVGTAPTLPSSAGAPSKYQQLLFDATAPTGGELGYSTPYTFRSFFAQLSNNLLDVQGDVVGWHTLAGNQDTYTGGDNCAGDNPYGFDNCNGIWDDPAQVAMQAALTQSLTASDAGVNFALYDNDGPDGQPASTGSLDDDGYVDIAFFIHSESDGACTSEANGGLWSHRSSLPFNSGNYFLTNDARSGGGFIKVRDYILQSGLGGSGSCTPSQIMSVGTVSHEFGHGLGLPDLYDTQQTTAGIGSWGLMGGGNYTSGASPTRMEAWSLNEVGWITLRQLTVDGTYTFGPVPTSDTAFVIRVQATNSRKEYYLLENRQAVQSDTAVIRIHCESWSLLAYPEDCRGGLAIWHVDSAKIQASQGVNQVNAGAIHGLSLVQADAYTDLEDNFNRGDAGDLWPGFGLGTPKTLYGLNSSPAALTNEDAAKFVGFRVDQITQTVMHGEMSLRVTFGRPLTTLAAGGALDGTLQLNPVSIGSFDYGSHPTGYRYITATYQVRNAALGGTAYPTARNNLTFLAVITPTTLNLSPVTQFRRFDESPVAFSAALMEPTGYVVAGGGGEPVGGGADVLQAYSETEVAAMSPIAGVTSVLPYGFVVRNPGTTNSRQLPASPGVGVYDGIVNFTFRLPLQLSPLDNPATIVARFLAVDDDHVRVTQSLQETDGASVATIVTRATNLGAVLRSLSETEVGGMVAEQVCIRTAGLSGAPTHEIGAGC